MEEFSKRKICWNRIATEKVFALVDKNILVQDSMHFFTGKKLDYLNAVLNSSLYRFFIFLIIGGAVGGNAGNADIVKELCVIDPDYILEKEIKSFLKEKKISKIDNIIYKMYSLTEEEITYINQYRNKD